MYSGPPIEVRDSGEHSLTIRRHLPRRPGNIPIQRRRDNDLPEQQLTSAGHELTIEYHDMAIGMKFELVASILADLIPLRVGDGLEPRLEVRNRR
jgi:hypothetical protein